MLFNKSENFWKFCLAYPKMPPSFPFAFIHHEGYTKITVWELKGWYSWFWATCCIRFYLAMILMTDLFSFLSDPFSLIDFGRAWIREYIWILLDHIADYLFPLLQVKGPPLILSDKVTVQKRTRISKNNQ